MSRPLALLCLLLLPLRALAAPAYSVLQSGTTAYLAPDDTAPNLSVVSDSAVYVRVMEERDGWTRIATSERFAGSFSKDDPRCPTELTVREIELFLWVRSAAISEPRTQPRWCVVGREAGALSPPGFSRGTVVFDPSGQPVGRLWTDSYLAWASPGGSRLLCTEKSVSLTSGGTLGAIEVCVKGQSPVVASVSGSGTVVHENEIQVKKRVAPVYPPKALELGLGEIQCKVRLFVTAKGKLDRVVFEACPRVFHQTAEEALQKWRWGPYESPAGERVPVQFVTSLRYRPD